MNIFQSLIAQFNKLISPYKPKVVTPPQKTNSLVKSPSAGMNFQPVQKVVTPPPPQVKVPLPVKPVANLPKINLSTFNQKPSATLKPSNKPDLITSFMNEPNVKKGIDTVKNAYQNTNLISGQAKDSKLKVTPKNVVDVVKQAFIDNPQRVIKSIELQMKGEKSFQPIKKEINPLTGKEIITRDQSLQFGKDEIKSLSENNQGWIDGLKGFGVDNNTASFIAPLLVAGGMAMDAFPVIGGGEKGLVSIAKNATKVEDFVKVVKSDPKLLEQATKLINDTKSPVKSIEDIFTSVKPDVAQPTISDVKKDLITPFKKVEAQQPVLKQELKASTSELPVGQNKGTSYQVADQASTKIKLGEQPVKDSSDEIIARTLKERKFVTSVKAKPNTEEAIIKGLEDSTRTKYNPITNTGTLNTAKDLVEKDLGKATKMVFESKGSIDDTTSAVGQLLIVKAQKAGDFTTAIRTVEQLAERATTSGQGIQALAMFGRLTPEGILRYAGTLVNRAKNAGRNVKLTEETAGKLLSKAEELQNLPEGREKILRTAELLRDVNEVVPPTMLKKISTIQTMAQLLNPKTLLRNLGGNTIFLALDNVSKLIASGLDVGVSKITGKRSVLKPSLITQFKGGVKGGKESLQEALRGVNTSNIDSKLEIPTGRVFKGKILGTAEKALNIGLRVPDKAFYQAAAEESLASEARIIAMNEGLKGVQKEARVIDLLANPTKEMTDIANFAGLYRTFQDKNAATMIFSGLKKSLNAGKEFGLGDLIIKYPKTPANLLMRAIDYSPIGFARSLKQVVNPLLRKGFNQKEFVESFARATVGTAGLTGIGAVLQKAGILTGAADKDADLRTLQKTKGQGQYSVNITALKRYVLSGFNKDEAKIKKGDTLVSYDWMQPMAVSLAMGAEIGKAQQNVKGGNVFDTLSKIATSGVSNLAIGIDTLAEQPLVSGVQRFFGGQSITDSIVDALLQAPSSMIPTLLSQVNQVIDNNTKETYDPNKYKQAMNYVLAKIPILSATMSNRSNTLGEDTQRYQNGSNNVFNVFVNPAFVNKYLPTPEADMVLELYRQTGEKVQVPRTAPQKITVDGVEKVLSQSEFIRYQKELGSQTKEIFGILKTKQLWKNSTNQEKVGIMQKVMEEINATVKERIFNGTGLRTTIQDKYESSPEAPKTLVDKIYLATMGIGVDPENTIKAIFTEERMRKISGNAMILERKEYLNTAKNGLVVDHIIPLALGGDNSDKNLRWITNDANQAKATLETKLAKELKNGTITKEAARVQITDWIKKYGQGQPYKSTSLLDSFIPKAYAAETTKVVAKVPTNMKQAATKNVPIIIDAFKKEGITDKRAIAYALATAEHESSFVPKNEIGGASQAQRLGYEGGANYAGRGFIQLTGISNYKKIGQYLKLDLVNHPELLNNPTTSARAMAAYFKLFGTATRAMKDFVDARRSVNGGEFSTGSRVPYNIATRANEYLASL